MSTQASTWSPARRSRAVVSIGIAPATVDDPLRGVRSLAVAFAEANEAATLESVTEAAAIVHRALELGWGGDRRVRIALGDLALCDRVTLRAIDRLRARRHPRLQIAARLDRDLFVALRRGPLAPEGLWDSSSTFQCFLADFLRGGEDAATKLTLDLVLPPLRKRTKARRQSSAASSLERIEKLVRCGQYEMALDEIAAALDGQARGDVRLVLYEMTGAVHTELGDVDAARRAFEIARELRAESSA